MKVIDGTIGVPISTQVSFQLARLLPKTFFSGPYFRKSKTIFTPGRLVVHIGGGHGPAFVALDHEILNLSEGNHRQLRVKDTSNPFFARFYIGAENGLPVRGRRRKDRGRCVRAL